MRYVIFLLTFMLAIPAHAQHKTVARSMLPPNKMSADMAIMQQNTGDIPLTAKEKRAREIDEAQDLEARKMKKWEKEYGELNRLIPDPVEKVIDVLTDEQKAALDPATRSIYDQKKVKRSQKPQ